MTPRQREKLGIYQQVIKTCDKNHIGALVPGHPGRFLHGFRSAVAAIECMDYLTGCVRNDRSPVADEFYNFLLPLADAMGNSLLALAGDTNNKLLYQKTTYILSHIRVASHDTRSASFVALAEAADAWLSSLRSYGINEAILVPLQISIENYVGITPGLSNVPAEPEAYQDCFRNVMYAANLLLKDRIDGLMEKIAGQHHRFYQSYRRIRTYGDINYLL